MKNFGFLFAANAFVWGGILVYVFSLMKRNQSLRKDLDMLKESLAREDRE